MLLDTQAFVDAFGGSELPRRVHALLALNIPAELVREAVYDLRISILPFDARHAYRLFSLRLHHRNPLDRMITATALVEGIAVVGADRVFRKYKGLKVIW